MIRKLLILLAVWLGAAWLLRRFVLGVEERAARVPAVTPRFEGAMVRDRVCRTFLPRGLALTVRQDEEEHFFCSEACREAFLSRRRAVR